MHLASGRRRRGSARLANNGPLFRLGLCVSVLLVPLLLLDSARGVAGRPAGPRPAGLAALTGDDAQPADAVLALWSAPRPAVRQLSTLTLGWSDEQPGGSNLVAAVTPAVTAAPTTAPPTTAPPTTAPPTTVPPTTVPPTPTTTSPPPTTEPPTTTVPPSGSGGGGGGNSVTGAASWYQAPAGTCAAPGNPPDGTVVTVTDDATGQSVTCTVDDYLQPSTGRVLDLAEAAFAQLADPSQGLIEVTLSW